MPSNFFDESEEQSAIKTAIVSKYFMAWAQVLADSQIPAFGREELRNLVRAIWTARAQQLQEMI